MQVKLKSWRGEIEISLNDALQPKSYSDAYGALEQTQAQAAANATAIGNLAALLVENNIINLNEAVAACGIYDTITPIKD